MKKTVWRSLCALALLPTLLTSCMAFDETDPLHEDSGPPPPMVDMAKLYLSERGGKVAPLHGAETVKNTESGKKRTRQSANVPAGGGSGLGNLPANREKRRNTHPLSFEARSGHRHGGIL